MKNVDSILNSIIAALSVAAVFAVLTLIPAETGEIDTDKNTTTAQTDETLVVIEEDPLFSTSNTTENTTTTTVSATVTDESTVVSTTVATTTTTTAAISESGAAIAAVAPGDGGEFSVEDDTTTTTKATTTTVKTTTKTTTTKKTTTTTLPMPEEVFEPEEEDLTYPEDEELEPEEDTEPDIPIDDVPATTTVSGGFPMWETTAKTTVSTTETAVIPTSSTLRISSGTVDAFSLICAVVEKEMGESFSDEAIKAQAVAAYSYIKAAEIAGNYASVTTDYTYSKRIENLVASVWGQAVYYNGKIVSTPYYASSAGYTASSANVWGGNLSYLVSVPTPFDVASDPNYGIKKNFTQDEMRRYLENSLGIILSDNPENWITVVSFSDSVYVEEVNIDGQKVISGRDFREDIMDFNIRSSAFSVTYSGGVFTVTTYGYGHGVGMSQHGANILASQGLSYIDILKYYYSGVTVQ